MFALIVKEDAFIDIRLIIFFRKTSMNVDTVYCTAWESDTSLLVKKITDKNPSVALTSVG